MDLRQVNETLNFYIRPTCFPLAIRMCESAEEVPSRARRPMRDMKHQIPVCQAMGIARRYGWAVALDRGDESCPFGALALGFYRRPETQDAESRVERSLPVLEHDRYKFLLVAPLHSATFEPHVIAVYGNSAQVMRLVQGCLHGRGGSLRSRASGAADCADVVAETMNTEECQFVLPCNGDRIFGLTQDHEMIFAMPASKVEMTLKGLEESHKSGAQRYPIPSFLRFEPQLPPDYTALMVEMRKEAGE